MADYSEIILRIGGRAPYMILCRNWSYTGIFIETVRLAAEYCDCTTIDQLFRRIYNKPLEEDVICSIEANIDYSTDDVYIVDLDYKSIYSYDAAIYSGGFNNLSDCIQKYGRLLRDYRRCISEITGFDLDNPRQAGRLFLELLLCKSCEDAPNFKDSEYEYYKEIEYTCEEIVRGSRIPFKYIDRKTVRKILKDC